MTPEEEFLGPNPPSCQDYQSIRPPPLPREFPACHPLGGCAFFWNNPFIFYYGLLILDKLCIKIFDIPGLEAAEGQAQAVPEEGGG